MAAEAVYGFIGVLLGSATTAVLTVYREQLASKRERGARQHQREQDQRDQRKIFQRESLLALQEAGPATSVMWPVSLADQADQAEP